MRITEGPANRRSRRGFTLIELMVIMAILATLMGIAAGAYFRVLDSQNKKRSETTVKKIMTGLDSQWIAVIDDVKNEINNGKVPQALITAVGGDRDRANVVYMKARLKQEFPVSFAEVTNPLDPLTSGTIYNALSPVIKRKQAYQQLLTATGLSAEQQSAACLFMALSQTRQGATFNADDIGPANIKSIPGKNVQVFVDAWAKPDCSNAIMYERWVRDDAALLGELDAMLPGTTTARPSKDPQDPQGKLFGTTPPIPATERTSLQSLFHPLDNHNRSPFIRSAGPDMVFGGNDDMLSFRMVKEGRSGN